MLSNVPSRALQALLSSSHQPQHAFFASSAVALKAVPQQGSSSSSSSATDNSGDQDPDCWTAHTKTCFSIRPSLLSPLYSMYRKDIDKHDRRRLISKLLEAHMLLARELEGFDVSQVTSIARDHANSLQHLSSDLEALAPRTSIGSCTHRGTMLGFYSQLERQLGSSEVASISSSGKTASSESAQAASAGPSSVWQAWKEQFVNKYQHSPSLEPLEAIYAKKDVLSTLRQLSLPSKDAQRRALQALGGGGKEQDGRARHGAHVTLQGVACAEGKRKTSRAMVRMQRKCSPRVLVSVNGQPFDEYFQGPELRQLLLEPMLLASGALQKFAVEVDVHGGGISSQAQAARTGIARALQLFVRSGIDGEEVSPAAASRSLAWLRRLGRWDKRTVERKKPGREKARKGFAWVKR